MRAILLLALSSLLPAQTPPPRSSEYDAPQHRLARGWNTWDVHSVAAQVLLPDGGALLGLIDYLERAGQ